jgi:hypothetical protein
MVIFRSYVSLPEGSDISSGNQTWQCKVPYTGYMGKSSVTGGFSIATFDCRMVGTKDTIL